MTSTTKQMRPNGRGGGPPLHKVDCLAPTVKSSLTLVASVCRNQLRLLTSHAGGYHRPAAVDWRSLGRPGGAQRSAPDDGRMGWDGPLSHLPPVHNRRRAFRRAENAFSARSVTADRHPGHSVGGSGRRCVTAPPDQVLEAAPQGSDGSRFVSLSVRLTVMRRRTVRWWRRRSLLVNRPTSHFVCFRRFSYEQNI